MNNKQVKKLRKQALTKAHSYNDTTMEDCKPRKLNEGYFYEGYINIVKGHFVQRRLHKMSVKRMIKILKTQWMNTTKINRSKLGETLC